MSTQELRLGWLGTGRMGSALAGRLLDAGHPLTVWNRTAAKTGPLVDRGATAVGSIVDLAACDVVFVMVSTPDDLLQVVSGKAGLLSADRRPSVVVDCSTVSADVSAQVRAATALAGVDFLAAPISGNPHVVAEGRACIVASGPTAAFDRVEPYLSAMSTVAVYAGGEEQSRLVKLCHNLYLGILTQALVEVTSLVEKGGTPRQAFLDFLNGTVIGSEWVRRRTPDLVALDWTPTFTTELMRKDFDLGLGAARVLEVPLPVAAVVHQLLQSAIGTGARDKDFLALYEQQAAGASLAARPATGTGTDAHQSPGTGR
jgi:3-hydroxyisobutyrate dehydrogenase-like beta-hydroxyacid dehydrogenase